MKLLIIDSNAAVRRLIRSIVADFAFDIQECANGADVTPLYQTVMPDFAVLDSDIDGSCWIALTKQIMISHPDAKSFSLPIMTIQLCAIPHPPQARAVMC